MPVPDSLFDPVDLPSPVKYKILFESLPGIDEPAYITGRKPVSRNSLLRALIYKALRRLPNLSDLSFELNNNLTLSKAMGFNPLLPAPSVERFSSFLHDSSNETLQSVQHTFEKNLQLKIFLSISQDILLYH